MCKHIETKMIPLDVITVAERIRKDNGDLQQLADDIQKRGIINPITVMARDEGYLLIAGFRRMEATRLLGETEVLASVVTAVDAEEQLLLEIAENEQRKEFTASERMTFAKKLTAVEKEKAKERMAYYAREGHEGVGDCPHPEMEKGKSRDMIAKKAGFSSEKQMRRAAYVDENRPDLMERVDSGEMTIHKAYSLAKNGDAEDTTKRKADAAKPEKPIAEQSIREIKSRIVTAAPIERETIEMFNPMTISVTGSKTSLKGADHEHLLDNPVYSALYDAYANAVQTANSALGRIFLSSEGYEKRIRGYEENIQAMHRTIEGLRAENEKLRAQLDGATHA